MPDYSRMSLDEFDRILCELVDERPASALLREVPNVWTECAEYYNNDVLQRWLDEQEDETDDAE